MKKSRFGILVLFLGFFLVLSGCSSDGDNRTSGIGIGSNTGSSGTSGINLKFAPGNPPSEMFKGQPYTFAFVFENFQEHDITDLRIRTRGFDRGLVSGLEESYTVSNLPRFSQQVGPGLFNGLVVQGVTVDNFVGNFNFNPEFELRYTAKTIFRDQLCVPSLNNLCEVEVDSSRYQRGPLRVNLAYINAIGSDIRLDFEVTNSGRGNLIGPEDTRVEFIAPYSVSASLGTSVGNCVPSGNNEFVVADGRGAFTCTFPRTSDSSYSSQLSLDVEYEYFQVEKLNILVRDLTQGFN